MPLADSMSRKPQRALAIDTLLQSLDDEDAAVLRGWLLDLSMSAGRIADALEDNGTPVTSNPIRLWRKRNVVS